MILKSGILTLQSLMETGVLLLDDSALGHPRNGGPGIIIIIAHPIPPLLLLLQSLTPQLSSNLPSTLNIALLDIESKASLSSFEIADRKYKNNDKYTIRGERQRQRQTNDSIAMPNRMNFRKLSKGGGSF